MRRLFGLLGFSSILFGPALAFAAAFDCSALLNPEDIQTITLMKRLAVISAIGPDGRAVPELRAVMDQFFHGLFPASARVSGSDVQASPLPYFEVKASAPVEGTESGSRLMVLYAGDHSPTAILKVEQKQYSAFSFSAERLATIREQLMGLFGMEDPLDVFRGLKAELVLLHDDKFILDPASPTGLSPTAFKDIFYLELRDTSSDPLAGFLLRKTDQSRQYLLRTKSLSPRAMKDYSVEVLNTEDKETAVELVLQKMRLFMKTHSPRTDTLKATFNDEATADVQTGVYRTDDDGVGRSTYIRADAAATELLKATFGAEYLSHVSQVKSSQDHEYYVIAPAMDDMMYARLRSSLARYLE
jgi:hypothetical protein